MVFSKLIPPFRRFQFAKCRGTSSLLLSSSAAAAASELPGSSSSSRRRSHGRHSLQEEADSSRRSTPGKSPYSYVKSALRLAAEEDEPRESEVRRKEMAEIDRPHFVESLGFLISRLCSEGKFSEALRIFRAACSEGRLPPISVCIALVSGFSGDLNSVVFVYKEIVKSGVAITVDVVNCLISALFKAGEVDLAMDQFRKMNRKGCAPNIRTFETVISGLCVHARVEESSAVLDEVIACSCPPDSDFFLKILPLFCKPSRSIEAKKLLQMMRNCDLLPDSTLYSYLICCLCENGELDDAANLFDEMSEREITPDNKVYTCFVDAFSRLGRFSEAEIFLESNNVLESLPYNAMLRSYCREHKFHRASNYLMKMLDKGVGDCSSWNILISALCLDSKNPRKASEVLSKMITIGYLPDDITFSSLISGYSKVGNIKNAMMWFHHVLYESRDLDSDSYSDLIRALLDENMIEQGIRVFYHMSSRPHHHNLPGSTVDLLISHMCRNGLVNDAIKLRSTSVSSGSNLSSTSVNSILLGLLAVNRSELSRVLFSQMIVEDCSLDVETYCLLIRARVSINGNNDDVIILLEQMIDINIAPDSETMIFVLNHLENCSKMGKIVRMLDKLVSQGQELSSAAYNAIIRGLTNEGHHHDACKFLDRMLEKGWIPNADTHRILVGDYGRERDGGLPEKDKRDDSLINLLAEGLRNDNDPILEE